MFVLRVCAG